MVVRLCGDDKCAWRVLTNIPDSSHLILVEPSKPQNKADDKATLLLHPLSRLYSKPNVYNFRYLKIKFVVRREASVPADVTTPPQESSSLTRL